MTDINGEEVQGEDWTCGDCGKRLGADVDFCPTERWVHDLALSKWNEGRRHAEGKIQFEKMKFQNAVIALNEAGYSIVSIRNK